MALPIGYDDFGTIIEKKLNFVDKSLFIKEVLDNDEVQITVITRPRRFGKTLNLSMLHYFLASEIGGLPTQGLFDTLKIASAGSPYMKQQGKYPVISVTFKSMDHDNYSSAYQSLCKLLSRLYSEHLYLLDSSKLAKHQCNIFESIVEERATESSIRSSLLDLTQALYTSWGQTLDTH